MCHCSVLIRIFPVIVMQMMAVQMIKVHVMKVQERKLSSIMRQRMRLLP